MVHYIKFYNNIVSNIRLNFIDLLFAPNRYNNTIVRKVV